MEQRMRKIGPTIHELELYLETYLSREDRAASTINSKRARLAKYARTYADHHGSADIVIRVREDDIPRREERQRVREVFDTFETTLGSVESRYKHLTDVRLFYEWLVGDRDAPYNPALGVPHETKWSEETPNADDRDPDALEADDVRALADACERVSDRLLVVATCAGGLRRGEVAALSTAQFEPRTNDGGFDFDADDLRIVFETRKNGPATVSVHYGLETLADRWAQLADRDEWDGEYLFPSTAAASGHIRPDTVTNRFKRLVERAGLDNGDGTPTPQYGRRFWYQTYADAVERLSSQIEAVADKQDSDDAQVVVENYLGEKEVRRRRREFMREELADAFEED